MTSCVDRSGDAPSASFSSWAVLRIFSPSLDDGDHEIILSGEEPAAVASSWLWAVERIFVFSLSWCTCRRAMELRREPEWAGEGLILFERWIASSSPSPFSSSSPTVFAAALAWSTLVILAGRSPLVNLATDAFLFLRSM